MAVTNATSTGRSRPHDKTRNVGTTPTPLMTNGHPNAPSSCRPAVLSHMLLPLHAYKVIAIAAYSGCQLTPDQKAPSEPSNNHEHNEPTLLATPTSPQDAYVGPSLYQRESEQAHGPRYVSCCGTAPFTTPHTLSIPSNASLAPFRPLPLPLSRGLRDNGMSQPSVGAVPSGTQNYNEAGLYIGPQVGYFAPPALNRNNRAQVQLPTAAIPHHFAHPQAMPTWAAGSYVPFVSPYNQSSMAAWQDQNVQHGLPMGPSITYNSFATPYHAIPPPGSSMTRAVGTMGAASFQSGSASPSSPVFNLIPANAPRSHFIQGLPPSQGISPSLATTEWESAQLRVGSALLDQDAIRKQEIFNRKAQHAKERRRGRDTDKQSPGHPKAPATGSERLKQLDEATLLLQREPPAYQLPSRPEIGYMHTLQHQQQHIYFGNRMNAPDVMPTPQHASSSPGTWETREYQNIEHVPYQGYSYCLPDGHMQLSDHFSAKQLALPSHLDKRDDPVSQPITTDYADYEWPVKLYTLDEERTGNLHAESWLDMLFEKLRNEPNSRWFAHITKGFIKYGNRLTFLVLYNAANPFRSASPPDATTSIGCYGYYWRDHSEIHWTTFDVNLQPEILGFLNRGLITEVYEWRRSMKPTEARFHRAYWLAATMSRLGNMLNRPLEQVPDTDMDIVEDDDDFEISELDLVRITDARTVLSWFGTKRAVFHLCPSLHIRK